MNLCRREKSKDAEERGSRFHDTTYPITPRPPAAASTASSTRTDGAFRSTFGRHVVARLEIGHGDRRHDGGSSLCLFLIGTHHCRFECRYAARARAISLSLCRGTVRFFLGFVDTRNALVVRCCYGRGLCLSLPSRVIVVFCCVSRRRRGTKWACQIRKGVIAEYFFCLDLN